MMFSYTLSKCILPKARKNRAHPASSCYMRECFAENVPKHLCPPADMYKAAAKNSWLTTFPTVQPIPRYCIWNQEKSRSSIHAGVHVPFCQRCVFHECTATNCFSFQHLRSAQVCAVPETNSKALYILQSVRQHIQFIGITFRYRSIVHRNKTSRLCIKILFE